MAPPYLAADCQLISDEGRRQLRSSNPRTCRQKDLQQLWRQMLCCCGSEVVKQSASSSQTGINFEQVYTTVKDNFARAMRARRIVAIVKLRLLNNLTYLLTYV